MFRRSMDIATMEATVAMRSGWVRGFGALFGAGIIGLALMTATTGTSFAGFGFDRASATALSIMLMAVPLVSAIVGVNTMAVPRGQWEIFASQPLTIPAIVTGKWIGIMVSVGGAVAASFGLSGLLLSLGGATTGAGAYATLGVVGILLVGVFTGIGLIVGAAVTDRGKALLVALLVWLLLVFFYDWLIIGVALMTGKRLALSAVWTALVLNPVDLARVITIAGIGALDLLGPTGAVLARSGPLTYSGLWVALSAWAALPIIAAGQLANRLER